MNKKRILALDPGTKRIGVALSDEMGWIAQPLETFERRSITADLTHIRHLVHEHEVDRVILGMPFRLDGSVGPAAEQVGQFKVMLEGVLTVPIIPWDERLTSKSAEAILIEANVSRRKRKGAVDRVAAAILLQSYLESLSAEKPSSSSDSTLLQDEATWDDP
ncbi:MAG TPA: Holliday junction resolvase RuvX [Nitrospiraceae bacterium]|nr:Holliday junction resolvase RuvX [Nitrospiraceae bacterium]